MNKINFQSGLFLGKQELVVFQEAIEKNINTFYKINTKTFGIMPDTNGVSGKNSENFKVYIDSSENGTLRIPRISYAMDSDYNMITQQIKRNIQLPADNQWYWIKAAYQQTYLESGVVSITTTGVVVATEDPETGAVSNFNKLFRGMPNQPSVIKFFNSVNTGEYEVLSVTSETDIIINGQNLVAEDNVKFAVVGTFVPDLSVLDSYKYPFRYDSCKNYTYGVGIEYTMSREITEDEAPVRVLGKEFYLARATFDGLTTTVQDKREEFFKFRWE